MFFESWFGAMLAPALVVLAIVLFFVGAVTASAVLSILAAVSLVSGVVLFIMFLIRSTFVTY
jgi:hypothetical protein